MGISRRFFLIYFFSSLPNLVFWFSKKFLVPSVGQHVANPSRTPTGQKKRGRFSIFFHFYHFSVQFTNWFFSCLKMVPRAILFFLSFFAFCNAFMPRARDWAKVRFDLKNDWFLQEIDFLINFYENFYSFQQENIPIASAPANNPNCVGAICFSNSECCDGAMCEFDEESGRAWYAYAWSPVLGLKQSYWKLSTLSFCFIGRGQ